MRHQRLVRQVVGILLALGFLHAAGPAQARVARAPTPRAETAKVTEELASLRSALEQSADRERALSAALSEAREAIARLQQKAMELEGELRQARETQHNLLEQVRDLREEVRGLYVESSGVKGDIAQLGDKLDSLIDELGSFRLSAGILAALVVLLQIVAIGLSLRSGKT